MRNSLNENIIKKYCDSIWIEKGLSKNTISSYALDLKHLKLWLENNGRSFIHCSEEDLNTYLASKFESTFKSERLGDYSLIKFNFSSSQQLPKVR